MGKERKEGTEGEKEEEGERKEEEEKEREGREVRTKYLRRNLMERFTKTITLLTWPDQSIEVTIRFWLQRLSKNALFLATVILVIPSLHRVEEKWRGGGWRRADEEGTRDQLHVLHISSNLLPSPSLLTHIPSLPLHTPSPLPPHSPIILPLPPHSPIIPPTSLTHHPSHLTHPSSSPSPRI